MKKGIVAGIIGLTALGYLVYKKVVEKSKLDYENDELSFLEICDEDECNEDLEESNS